MLENVLSFCYGVATFITKAGYLVEKSQIVNIIEFMVPFLFSYSRIIIILAIVLTIQFVIAEYQKKETSWFGVINKVSSPYKYLSFSVLTYLFAFVGCACIGFWVIFNHITGMQFEGLMLSAIALQFLSLLSLLFGVVYAAYTLLSKKDNLDIQKSKMS